MLVQLYIENVAVIQKANIELTQGFNVFTGETGAGKTVLISAIDAVLGERTSKDIIRTGESKAVISAMFENLPKTALDKLEELGFSDDEGTVLITREITEAGRTTCRIGGMPATTAILREIAPLLIHIHGQRDSHVLLSDEQHIQLVDAYGELGGLLEEYAEIYASMTDLQKKLRSINEDESQKAQRIDMLTFQINEIEAAKLDDEQEEETLLARRGVIRNSEKILRSLAASYEALSGGDQFDGILTLMDTLTDEMSEAAQFIADFESAAARIQEMQYELQEYSGDIRSYLDEFEFDPRELDDIERRIDTIYQLKRKYGASIAEILEFYEQAQQELESISTSGQRMEKLSAQLVKVTAQAEKLAATLTKKRMDAAKNFIIQVEQELAFLDMPSVKLSVARTEQPLTANGSDDIVFMIVTNVGEQPKPLSKIASGGEISRIMLAIKNVLADRDHIPTLVFDEVDTGVSGRAAQKIGQKLREVSRSRQVLCVTHLAQVAAFSDSHLLIAKNEKDGRTYTKVTPLDEQQTIEQLARIAGGDRITDIALENARQLRESSLKE